MFQLGMVLWLIMESKPKGIGYFCVRAVCTQKFRYRCEADHKNPVELPRSGGLFPDYLHEIVKSCRSQDPKARPSARELDMALKGTADPQINKCDIDSFLLSYATVTDTNGHYCDECGSLTIYKYFHCNVCHSGDFDICPGCYEQGVRYYDTSHLLVKRMWRN